MTTQIHSRVWRSSPKKILQLTNANNGFLSKLGAAVVEHCNLAREQLELLGAWHAQREDSSLKAPLRAFCIQR